MRYFGSKASTVESLYELISARVSSGTFCDPFGGIGVVGSHFKSKGYSVWTGDILAVAHCFQVARVALDRRPQFRKLRTALGFDSPSETVELLRHAGATSGWLTREFSENRKFFTRPNAMRIDACRTLIGRWCRNGWLTPNERALLLASLINSMDKVANTAGTYYAYLKQWHRKALLPFRFDLIPYTKGRTDCRCFLLDAGELVSKSFFDILYLDPPYNERSYASYYHLPESMARGQTPRAKGRFGVPHRIRSSSNFNRPTQAQDELRALLEKASFRLLAFHYSDDGLIRPSQLKAVFRDYGRVEEFVLDSRGYTTRRTPRNIEHRLYLVHR